MRQASSPTLYRLPGMTYVGRFRIGEGRISTALGAPTGSSWRWATSAPTIQGLLVAQGGDNAPDTQNFKYVNWAEVLKALGLYSPALRGRV